MLFCSCQALAAGVQLILGLNGVIWVSAETKHNPGPDSPLMSEAQPVLVRDVTKAERQAIARVANCIRALAKLYFSIHPASILSVYTVRSAFPLSLQRLCILRCQVGVVAMLTTCAMLLNTISCEL